jgi:hypothetical protein
MRTHYQFANWTALHWAATSGKTTCIKPLIGHGADVNALSDNKQTPLHVAVLAGSARVIEVLAAAGVSMCIYVCVCTCGCAGWLCSGCEGHGL